MTAATPAERELARWLLMKELRGAPETEALSDAAERACQKLCRRVARLVTVVGCQMLLARALHLARAEFPFLAGVEANPTTDTYLAGLQARAEDVEPSTLRDAFSMRLVRDVWPDVPIGEGPAGAQEWST